MTLPSFVGRYAIRGEIARGGVAVVALAWDEELESLVAIKILHGHLAGDPRLEQRFIEEARLLRRIRAPNVISVHDVGRLGDGCPYFVMDYADRDTLEERLNRFPDGAAADVAGLMRLVDALAAGLGALHDAGLVHRDIKPANILFQSSPRSYAALLAGASTRAPTLAADHEQVLVGDLGLAQDIVSQGSLPEVLGGTPLYRAPEQSDAVAEISPAADIYGASALLWAVLTGEPPPEPGLLGERLARLSEPWREVIETGMAAAPAERFGDIAAWHAAVTEAASRDESGCLSRGTETFDRDAPCPYKGLAAYQPGDAAFFRGREVLIDELVRRLREHRVLVVGGPSGSGKSSLIRAGLIPVMEGSARAGSEPPRIALCTPGHDPLGALWNAIGPASGLDAFRAHPEGIAGPPTEDSGQSWLICIDQFEELFTLAPEADRDAFIATLAALSDPAEGRVRIVIGVRADFYTRCAQLPWLARHISRNQVLVGPMGPVELRRAIEEPARHAGFHLEAGLTELIVADAGSEAGALPLVAHALVETWVRRSGNLLTIAAYREAGGVAGAISRSAEAIYRHSLDEIDRDCMRRLFLRLVSPGEQALDTRQLLPRVDIERDPEAVRMRRIVEQLTRARLLSVDDSHVQIAHEALLRTWPRLADWIAESRDDLRSRQRISRAAGEWLASGENPDLLYHGTPLLAALEWAGRHADQIGDLERRFLDEARRVAEDRQRRRRRLRGGVITGLAALALGAVIASLIAWSALRESRHSQRLADAANRQAQARFAAALGSAALGRVRGDPLLALALAAESIARTRAGPPAHDARAALLEARRVLAKGGVFPSGSPIPAGDALAIDLSPDGRSLAMADRGGQITLIDTRSRQPLGDRLVGHQGAVRDVAFSADGRLLASGGTDGELRVWPLAGRGESRLIAKSRHIVMKVGFSANGRWLASAGEQAVRCWDLDREPPGEDRLIARNGAFNTLAFSPDDRGLIASYTDGSLFGWRLANGNAWFEPLSGVHRSHLVDLDASPDGRHLASVDTDGRAMLTAYREGKAPVRLFGEDVFVTATAFRPDGRQLVGAARDGRLRLWDIQRGRVGFTSGVAHDRPIVDLRGDARGRAYATLGEDQVIRLWRSSAGIPMSTERRVAGGAAKAVAYSPDGRYLAAGDKRGGVQVWDRRSGDTAARRFGGHEQQVWAMAFSPTRPGLLASADRGGRIILWDLAEGKPLKRLDAGDMPVWSLHFTPDGGRLISAGARQVSIWDVASGEQRASLAAGDAAITAAALSGDGRLLATAHDDGHARLWDLATRRLTREIAADDNRLWNLAFSPDGRFLATASSDEVVSLWRLQDGSEYATFGGHGGGATALAFLSDGATLVVTDRRGNLHWWDVVGRTHLSAPLKAHRRASWRLAVHPDGRRLATSGDDGWIREWDVFSPERACEISAAAFDTARRRQYLGEEGRSLACAGSLVDATPWREATD